MFINFISTWRRGFSVLESQWSEWFEKMKWVIGCDQEQNIYPCNSITMLKYCLFILVQLFEIQGNFRVKIYLLGFTPHCCVKIFFGVVIFTVSKGKQLRSNISKSVSVVKHFCSCIFDQFWSKWTLRVICLLNKRVDLTTIVSAMTSKVHMLLDTNALVLLDQCNISSLVNLFA